MRASNSNIIRMTLPLLRFFIIAIISFVIAVQGIVTVQLVNNRIKDAHTYAVDLQASTSQGVPNFKQWANLSAINNHIHAKVTSKKGTFKTENYNLFAKRRHTKLPLSQHFYQIDEHGFYYFDTYTKNQVTYEIWTDFSATWRIIKTLFMVSFIILIIFIYIGYLQIKRIVRQINQPLLSMVKQLQAETTQPIAVADASNEIQATIDVVNQILSNLNKQLQHEKQFIADASHELRTPIASIQGNVALIKRRGAKNPEVIPTALAYIEDQTHRLQNLVEELLQLSRDDHRVITTTSFDLTALIQSASQPYNNVVLTSISPVLINSDLSIWQHVVNELLLNARKYSPTDASITVSAMLVNNRIVFKVADQGLGIPDDQKQHVFDRLVRLDTSRSQHITGSGLGLSIVQNLVTLLQGHISIADNSPHGTVFTVSIPNKKEPKHE